MQNKFQYIENLLKKPCPIYIITIMLTPICLTTKILSITSYHPSSKKILKSNGDLFKGR